MQIRSDTALAGPRPLAPRAYLGYGLGDFAFNFYWLPLQVFLLKYYTDVLGLEASTAGLITMICLIWDGLVDPYVGILANRTRSRFGRYRPYMLFGSIPLAASFTLVFMPVTLEGSALVAYALATQLLFRTVYAVVNIPYGAMMASMTRSSHERNWLAGTRMLFAFSGSAVVGYFTPLLVARFSDSHGSGAYFVSAAILSSFATLILFACFAGTRERVDPGPDGSGQARIADMLRMVVRNTPFLQAAAGIALFAIAQTVHMASLAYYVQYVALGDARVTASLVGMLPLVQMFAIAPWTLASRWLGKRVAWMSGLAISSTALLTLYAIDAPSISTLFVLVGVSAFGFASIAVNFWSMVPDTVEYGEWRSGVRAEGFVFGLVTLIQKAALGLASAFAGAYLGWIGYVPNIAQDASTQQGLRVLISLAPALFLLASCAVIYFYRLDAETHSRLVREIDARAPVTG